MMVGRGGTRASCSTSFRLEDRIPENHLLRRINVFVTTVLADLHKGLESFYSDIGRPSVDPELTYPDARRRLLLWHSVGAQAHSGS
jgi:hypothetical protein